MQFLGSLGRFDREERCKPGGVDTEARGVQQHHATGLLAYVLATWAHELTDYSEVNRALLLLIIFVRTNLYILPEPLQRLLIEDKILAGFGCANVPGAGNAHQFNRNLPDHFQPHVELF